MSVSFLNDNFKSLSDLKQIDVKINEIEKQRKKLKDQVSGNPAAESVDGDYSEEELYNYREKLYNMLPEMVQIGDTEKILLNLVILENNFGPMKVFASIKALVEEKKGLTYTRSLLKRYTAITARLRSINIDADKALDEMCELSSIVADFKSDEPDPEHALSISLSTFLGDLIEKLSLKLGNKLKESVKESNWLKAETIPSHIHDTMIQEAKNLIVIQSLKKLPTYPETFTALDIIIEPFITRFTYHFESNKETNRMDKPEWALDFLERFLEANLSNIKLIFNNLLLQTPAADRFFVYEFISSTLVPIRSKILSLVSKIENPRLLTHLIFELQNFDQRLKTTYLYNPYASGDEEPAKRWHGLTGDILANSNVFDNWLNMEKELALSRFQALIETENAFHIDVDASATERKPTHSSVGLKNLIENITSHYKNLNVVKYQLKFVSLIQLNILNLYYERLNDGFEAFQTAFSSRLMNNKEELKLVQGLEGIERLCRLYCSCRFVIDSMEGWNEELIFLQLWNAFQSRQKTSGGARASHSTLFGALIESYSNLSEKIVKIMNAFFSREIYSCFKAYMKLNKWSVLPAVTDASISSELTQPLNKLMSQTSFLSKTLSKIDNLLLLDDLTTELATYLIELIIKNNQFNNNGVSQFSKDIIYIRESMNLPTNNKKYETLIESLKVLNANLDDIDPAFNDLRSYRREGNFSSVKRKLQIKILNDHEINDLLSRII